ncbi:MAG: DUF502 domain-containing protein [Thermodesulfobacteriota bacterium]
MRIFFSTVMRFFFTGVAAILPFIVTVFLAGWLVGAADAYVGPRSTFGTFLYKIFGERLAVFGSPWAFPGYLVGYTVVVLLIVLLGFLVTRATVSRIHQGIDGMFARIPLLGKIYSGVGQVVELFGKKDESGLERFWGIGYVEFGDIRMLALLPSGETYTLSDGLPYYLVFIPNAPIPATGFTALVQVEKVHLLDMPMEDMAKLMMSLGVLGPQVLKKGLRSPPATNRQSRVGGLRK